MALNTSGFLTGPVEPTGIEALDGFRTDDTDSVLIDRPTPTAGPTAPVFTPPRPAPATVPAVVTAPRPVPPVTPPVTPPVFAAPETDPDLAGARVEGHMVTFDPKAAAPGTTSNDTVYEDRDDDVETHGMRFTRDTVVAFGRHEAFRVNRHGVPVFSPGWTAARSALRAWVRTVLLIILAASMFTLSAVMIQNQVGTDPEYHRINETGITTEAKVTQIVEGKNPAGLPANVYTANWSGDGESGRIVIDTTTNPLASDKHFRKGDTIPILVDAEDHDNWLYAENKPLLGKVNPLNVMPILIGGGLATAAAAAAWLAWRLTELAVRTRIDSRRAAATSTEDQEPVEVTV